MLTPITPINNNSLPKPSANATIERATVKLFSKYPAHQNYFCSYEVFIETEMFKPDPGRTAMIYVIEDNAAPQPLSQPHAFFDYGRFSFFLPKSVQPVFDAILTNKNQSLVLTLHFVSEGNRPAKDQTEASFRLELRDNK